MLPTLHQKAYQQLLNALVKLRDHLSKGNSNETVQENFQQIQHIFQEQILSLKADEIYGESLARWQSVQTEIYRANRLLQTDMLFLGSSRQAATSQQRLATVRDRLDKLIGYCQVLLQED